MVATSFLSKTEFALGNLDRAATLSETALRLAREQGHPIALGIGYLGQMFLATETGDLALSRSTAEEALRHARKHDLSNYELWVAFHRAALQIRTEPRAAIAAMEDILIKADVAGSRIFRPAQLGLLGAAYGRLGQFDDAMSRIDAAIDFGRKTHILEPMPALYRLKAKTWLGMQQPDAARRDAERSWSIAQAQSARMEELRAATMLATLLSGSERQEGVLEELSRLHALFKHGLQTPDVTAAARTLVSFGLSA